MPIILIKDADELTYTLASGSQPAFLTPREEKFLVDGGFAEWTTEQPYTGNRMRCSWLGKPSAVKAGEGAQILVSTQVAAHTDKNGLWESNGTEWCRRALLPLAQVTAMGAGGVAAVNAAGQVVNKAGSPVSGGADITRTTPVRVATFGDSTANTGGTVTDQTYITAAFPASGGTTLSLSADKWLLNCFYPPAYLVANGGISGQTTQQAIDRSALATSATRKAVEDIINLSPDVVILRLGSINDLTSATSENVSAKIETCYANHISTINALLQGVPYIIDEGIFGYSGGMSLSDAVDGAVTRAALVELNARYKAYAAANPRVKWSGTLGVTSAPDGSFLPGMTQDGKHHGVLGMYTFSAAEGALVASMYGKAAGNRYFGTNLMSNPLLTQRGSTAAGIVATGYSVIGTNATAQNAKIEDIDGRSWQTCEFVPTAASPKGVIALPYTPNLYGLTATDKLGIEFDWFVQGLGGSGLPAVSQCLARVDTLKTGAGRIILEGFTTSLPATWDNTPMKFKVVFPLWLVGEASAAIQANGTTAFAIQFTAAEATGFKVGVSGARIVKNPT